MKKRLHNILSLLCFAFITYTVNAQSIIPAGAKAYKGKITKAPAYVIQPIWYFVNTGGGGYELIVVTMKFNGPPTHSFNGQDYYYSYGNVRLDYTDFVVDEINPELSSRNTTGSSGNQISFNYTLFLPYDVATDNFMFPLFSIKGNSSGNCSSFNFHSFSEFPPTRIFNNSGEINGVVADLPSTHPDCLSIKFRVNQTSNNTIQIEGQPNSNEIVNLSIYDLQGKRLFAKAIEPQNQYFLESVEFEHLRKNSLYILHFSNSEINKTIKYMAR